MIDKAYVKRLEAENAKLRQIIEDNGLKAGCYDFIIDHICTPHHPAKNVMNVSYCSGNTIDLLASARFNKNDIYAMKIIHDMIEAKKTDAGR